MNAAMVSTLFMVIIPYLFRGGRNAVHGRLDYKALLSLLIFTIPFVGTVIYSLSDLPAVFLCLLAAYEVEHMVEDTIIIKILVGSILFGAFAYSAYNVRTIYVFAEIYLIGYLICKLYQFRVKVIQCFIIVIDSVVGFAVAAFLQAYINYHECGEWTFKVITDGLITNQLIWGMKYQFYATYVSLDELTSPALSFMDNVGASILQMEGITDVISLGQYIRICLKYLFEMLGIYGRHFINSILLYGPEVYVEKLDSNKVLISFISFMCVLFYYGFSSGMHQELESNMEFCSGVDSCHMHYSGSDRKSVLCCDVSLYNRNAVLQL